MNKYKEMINKEGNNMEVLPHPTKEVLKEKTERPLIYRTYSVETRRIEVMGEVQVEKIQKPIRQGISSLARGKKFETVKVGFWEVATASLHSATPFGTDEVVLLPIYLGGGCF